VRHPAASQLLLLAADGCLPGRWACFDCLCWLALFAGQLVHHQVDVDALTPARHLLNHTPHLRNGKETRAWVRQQAALFQGQLNTAEQHSGWRGAWQCAAAQHAEPLLTSVRLKPMTAMSSITFSRGTLWVPPPRGPAAEGACRHAWKQPAQTGEGVKVHIGGRMGTLVGSRKQSDATEKHSGGQRRQAGAPTCCSGACCWCRREEGGGAAGRP
jgi:hypothetical protein